MALSGIAPGCHLPTHMVIGFMCAVACRVPTVRTYSDTGRILPPLTASDCTANQCVRRYYVAEGINPAPFAHAACYNVSLDTFLGASTLRGIQSIRKENLVCQHHGKSSGWLLLPPHTTGHAQDGTPEYVRFLSASK